MSLYNILFFATLKDRTGVRRTTVNLPDGITVGALKVMLQDQYPSITPVLPNVLIAVNREYALDDTIIPPEAEIALFPPVSGG